MFQSFSIPLTPPHNLELGNLAEQLSQLSIKSGQLLTQFQIILFQHHVLLQPDL